MSHDKAKDQIGDSNYSLDARIFMDGDDYANKKACFMLRLPRVRLMTSYYFPYILKLLYFFCLFIDTSCHRTAFIIRPYDRDVQTKIFKVK